MKSLFPRWAIFISGRGSNAQAAFDMLGQNKIQVCVSSSEKALGVLRARRMGIPVLLTKKYNKTNLFLELHNELLNQRVTHIFLLGYMRLLPPFFTDLWKNKIFNLHPSLLPMYPGLNSIENSYSENNLMGVTVHRVTEEMDAGEIIFQQKICNQGRAQEFSLEHRQLQISALEQKLVRSLFFKTLTNKNTWRDVK